MFINNIYNSCTSVSIWVNPIDKSFKPQIDCVHPIIPGYGDTVDTYKEEMKTWAASSKGKLGCAGLRLPYCDEEGRETQQNVNYSMIYAEEEADWYIIISTNKDICEMTTFGTNGGWKLQKLEASSCKIPFLSCHFWLKMCIRYKVYIHTDISLPRIRMSRTACLPASAPAAVTRGSTCEVWLHRVPSLRQSETLGSGEILH